MNHESNLKSSTICISWCGFITEDDNIQKCLQSIDISFTKESVEEMCHHSIDGLFILPFPITTDVINGIEDPEQLLVTAYYDGENNEIVKLAELGIVSSDFLKLIDREKREYVAEIYKK